MKYLTIDRLKALNTNRLLALKRKLNVRIGYVSYCIECNPNLEKVYDWENLCDYFDSIKKVLSERPHVPRA